MSDNPFERLAQKIVPGSHLLRSWPLTGGVSAQITALEIQRPDGAVQKMVVRQHGALDLAENPHVALDEFRLLTRLQAEGLAAPKPYYADESGEILPSPYIVVEFIDGQTEFAPVNLPDFIRQLAAYTASVHRIRDDIAFLSDPFPDKFKTRPDKLDESLQEGRIRAVLEAVWPLSTRNPVTLLHGDFWPGNVLWKDGQIAAVIDWEDAKIGDPLTDLSNTRLEMLWTFGEQAMNDFTQHYQSLTHIDLVHLPYWDLVSALRPAFRISEWAGNAEVEKTMRERHHLFVAQALEKLGLLAE